ncbi:putative membrane protein [Labrenzia sp. EL_13]|nr:putative membrane protein [Labrenzia sp. EL_13]
MQLAEREKPTNPAAGILLVVILMIAAFLRFYELDRTSLWYDEAVSWSQSKGTLAELLASVAADNYPPLHNVILWLAMPLIGDSEMALRMPSAALGVLAVWFVYLIGKHLAGREAGLLAAALLALSPLHIWYSTEARMYALLAACGLVFLFAVLKVLQRPSSLWIILLVFGGTCFLYSHVYALFAFAGVGIVCASFALAQTRSTKSLAGKNAVVVCLAMAASTISFLPWLYLILKRARSVADEGFWIAYPDLPFLETLVFGLAGSLALFWVLTGLALTGVLMASFSPPRTNADASAPRQEIMVCLAYTLGPAVLAYLYSVLLQPILFDRYLIAAWPGLIVLAAVGATRLLPRLAPVALVCVAIVLTYPQLDFTLNTKIRPEWRQIAEYFEENSGPEDRLLLYKGFAAPVLSYYLRDPDQFKAVEVLDQLKESLGTQKESTTWLLLVHSNEQETSKAAEIFLSNGGSEAIRAFGWGASGLTLLTSNQNTR